MSNNYKDTGMEAQRDEDMTVVATVGHNKPPSLFDDAQENIENLFGEAHLWLDGEEVTSEETAEGIAKLLDMLRKAGKEAEALRVEEKKPHDDAAKAVQAKYRPLTDKVKLATDACKKAIGPWQIKKDAALREREDAKRLEAKAAEDAAQAARDAANKDDLAAQAELEELEHAAKKTKIAASKASKATAKVATGGTAISLRTSYKPELNDAIIAIRHYWPLHQQHFEELLLELATADVRAGKRDIPGFTLTKEMKAQ